MIVWPCNFRRYPIALKTLAVQMSFIRVIETANASAIAQNKSEFQLRRPGKPDDLKTGGLGGFSIDFNRERSHSLKLIIAFCPLIRRIRTHDPFGYADELIDSRSQIFGRRHSSPLPNISLNETFHISLAISMANFRLYSPESAMSSRRIISARPGTPSTASMSRELRPTSWPASPAS